jgi:hypothetical protein
MTVRGKLSDEELRDLHLEVFLEFQKEQEEKGVIPRSERNVLTRFRGFFEFVGAVQLAFFLACLTILANFVIVRMMFHLDFSRYFG